MEFRIADTAQRPEDAERTVCVLEPFGDRVGIPAPPARTDARRTREIGIRAALGARPGRIVTGIFSRALLQRSAGILADSGLGCTDRDRINAIGEERGARGITQSRAR